MIRFGRSLQGRLHLPLGPDTSVLAIIAAFTVFRLILAATLGLGVDEAYTISVAHDLNLSYYDHPPLQYWIVHAFMPLLGDGRAARLPFIALFAGSCWLLYRLTRTLFGAEAGVVAVAALNCSAVFTLADGGWVLPDGPLLFAQLAAAVVIANHFFPAGNENRSRSPYATWLPAGFWIGVAGLSKYHAVLFAFGLLLWLVSEPARRRTLLHPAPWLGALLALVIVSPVILWNSWHGWASIAFQSGRGLAHGGLHIGNFFVDIGGQAVWMLPWVFVPVAIAAWQSLRAGRAAERSWFCLCLAAPIIVIFTIIPLWGDRGLPHWEMPGWLMLFPVLGDYAVRTVSPARLRRIGIKLALIVVTLAALFVGHAATGYGRILLPFAFAKGDPTLESFEWSQLPAEFKARGLLPRRGTFIVTTSWIYAAKIDIAFKGRVPIVVFRNEVKEYGLRYDPKSFLGRDALVVGPVKSMTDIDKDLLGYFESVQQAPSLALGRAGMREIELSVYQAHNLKAPLPAQQSGASIPSPAATSAH